MKTLKGRIKENAKHIDWNAVIILTVLCQIVAPAIMCFIEGSFTSLIVCTAFCCVFFYSTVLNLLIFGKGDDKLDTKYPKTEQVRCHSCGQVIK